MKRYITERNPETERNKVKEMYLAGHTQSVIAKAIGKTKGAVAGMINRMGIKNRSSASNGLEIQAGMRKKKKADGIPDFPPSKIVREKTSVPEPKSLQLDIVSNTGCSFITDGLCCGHTKQADSSYCQHHHERCHTFTPEMDLTWLDELDEKGIAF